jgi:hypothetical protein
LTAILTACESGRLFSRCLNTATYLCQYCGRHFCDEHAYYVFEHEAVCDRKRCRLKRDDMVEHLAYERRVAQRNNVGLCGIEDCGPHPGYQCSLCHGRFCDLHLRETPYTFRDGWSVSERMVSACPRCHARRKIWRGR